MQRPNLVVFKSMRLIAAPAQVVEPWKECPIPRELEEELEKLLRMRGGAAAAVSRAPCEKILSSAWNWGEMKEDRGMASQAAKKRTEGKFP